MKKWKLAIVIVPVVILVGYIAYQRGFEAGRDYTAQTDSTAPKHWVNKKWGYEITFPAQWEAIKRTDATIKSPGADVFCRSRSGASTAVFIYQPMSGDTLEGISNEVLDGYKKIGEVNVIEKKDYVKDAAAYKKVIFVGGKYTHYYTVISSKKFFFLFLQIV